MTDELSPERPRGGPARTGAAAVLVALLAVAATAGTAQSGPPVDDEAVTMEMLLEKTIFQVDVLTLTVRIKGDRAARLRELARSGPVSEEATDSVARIAAGATRAWAQLEFVRDVSMDRFLDAIRESSRAAVEAGFIDREAFDFIDRSLPKWYSFLVERGVKEGDRMTYRIDGDTLETRYRTHDGDLLLQQTDVGAARRRSVLGGYFAPGSDFREGLVRSLFRDDRERARGDAARPDPAEASAGAGGAGPFARDDRTEDAGGAVRTPHRARPAS